MISFIDKIENLKEDYYSCNRKKFFNRSQKNHCSAEICKQVELWELIENTVYIIPDTNCVYLDYTIFKIYANPENFDVIVDYILSLFTCCIEKYNCFEMHINLKTFTITAVERYKKIIDNFIKKCIHKTTPFTEKTAKLCIYNTPSMVDTITKMLKPFVEPGMKNKIEFYNKDTSINKIEELFSKK